MTPKSKVRVDTRLNALAFADEPAVGGQRELPRPTQRNMYEGTNQMTKDEKWHEPPTEPAGRCTGLFLVLLGPTRPHTLHGAHKHPSEGTPAGQPRSTRANTKNKMFGWLKSSSKTPAARRQELRDASRPPKGTTTEAAKSPLARRNTAPAFAREQARRERAMMSSSFRRRMTWQQSLCVAPVIQLPPSERLAK